MTATYTLTKDELNFEFLENIKKLITNDEIHLTIESYDDTEYLLRSTKNNEILNERIKYVENGNPLIIVSREELESYL